MIERDWRAPGDGLLTYDTVNQREWLDLSQTLRINFPPNYRVEDVALELEPGGMFEGFTWANIEDVTEFAQSAGIDTTTLDYSVNGAAAGIAVNLLSPTFGPTSVNNSYSVGFLNDTLPSSLGSPAPAYALFASLPSSASAGLALRTNVGDTARPPNSGLMLYRNVPEPNAFALLVVGLAGPVLVYGVSHRSGGEA
ncbi:cytochrome P450 [Aeoliella sp. ICT_H6.2]|uniref:Cytochrome P450 n=1 Tax=Aeoliella straminimaris TaxID=2954799 RepID=A0A9X2FFL6_9BACT|nr:cytochrome P450 [Aeoliella straminimaris]